MFSLLTKRTLLLIAALPIAHSVAHSEIPSVSQEALQKQATLIVTGEVKCVYFKLEKTNLEEYTNYIAEVCVDQCEKGEGVKKGDLVYIRYWNRRWIGKGPVPPSYSGHRGLIKEGAQIRAYLTTEATIRGKKDGGLNVLDPNGTEELKPARKP